MKLLFILLLTAGIVSAQTVTTTAPANMLLNDYKINVRVATTANVTIATALNAGDTIDGVTLVANDRVLVKSQSTASQNGIYVVSASPTRASDSNSWAELPGAVVIVTSGSTNGDTFWINTSAETGTVGSTSITYSQVSGGGGGGLTGSAGGNGAADSGLAALFDAGGGLTSSDGFSIIKSTGGYGASFDPDSLTAARAFSFPDVSGVFTTDNSTSTLTNKTLTSPAYTEVAIAALDIDWSAGSTFTKTLSANSTFTFSNLANGKTITVALTNTASNYTVNWPTVSWPGSVAPTQTIGAKTDIYSFWRINGVVYGSYVQNF
ncbi:MAG: hypothetical protein IPO08_21150 [Xanthomonadales bacterium]|nr:hypothetical protein [Xanthomonadales bacterium]